MKNLLYAFLSLFLVGCQNLTENKADNPKIIYQKIEDFNGYDSGNFCFELITKEKIYFAEVENNRLLDTAKTENYFQNYPHRYPSNSSAKVRLRGKDKKYNIEVKPFYYGSSLVIFEDKMTGVFYYTLMDNPKGVFFIENAYWIVGEDCHMGCYLEIKRIKDPKKLSSHHNFDSLVNLAYQHSHRELKEAYEKAETIFSSDNLSQQLLGFIPYQNSMILFVSTHKRDKKLDEYREEYNLDPAPPITVFLTLQIHQDKSIDTLENAAFHGMYGMPYDAVTILPKDYSNISFCRAVLEVENDTLFVYSLR